MTFPANVDADPDPTSQIAWPGRQGGRGRRASKHLQDTRSASGSRPSMSGVGGGGITKPPTAEAAGEKGRMSTLDLFNLSIAMGGSQVAWTVELG